MNVIVITNKETRPCHPRTPAAMAPSIRGVVYHSIIVEIDPAQGPWNRLAAGGHLPQSNVQSAYLDLSTSNFGPDLIEEI